MSSSTPDRALRFIVMEPPIAPGGPGDYGMVFIPGGYRRRRADTGRIVTALAEKLDAYPGERDLADGEDWL
jgi:hypothetical protein